MTKKAIIGFVAVGALIALQPVAKRMGHKMGEHCGQMAEQCKQMADQFGGRGEAVG